MANNVKIQTFDSLENKGFLWDLMYKNGTFEGLSSEMVNKVKDVFEQIMRESDIANDSNGVTEKNKRVLINMTERVRLLKTENTPVTASDISNRKREEFNNNLNLRQKEFNNMLQRPVPKEIDFSDKNDKPMSGDMDKILSDAIAKREREFNIVVEKQTKDNKSSHDTEQVKGISSIKIGDVIETPDSVEEPPNSNEAAKQPAIIKEVTFETESNLTNFDTAIMEQEQEHHFSPNVNTEVIKLYELMKDINAKQDIIIEMLKIKLKNIQSSEQDP